jgi:hypothetical protein
MSETMPQASHVLSGRLIRLRQLTDAERRSMLAWMSGYAPENLDQALARLVPRPARRRRSVMARLRRILLMCRPGRPGSRATV